MQDNFTRRSSSLVVVVCRENHVGTHIVTDIDIKFQDLSLTVSLTVEITRVILYARLP
ncbi:protein of unknown function [Kyrpidia spormannii]|uniref:Uncharacterized protein n=2 Tax=Kyrpidia spormannii TaxID=2055160 RepID=A0ACA8ZBT3_9BACL|nr:protein of unknown function [Kyrpidia spormannii]CAB3395277.1 protein of unknown function [Kyrpidia spormannii]